MLQKITDYMKDHIVYFDGAMGTMVQKVWTESRRKSGAFFPLLILKSLPKSIKVT